MFSRFRQQIDQFIGGLDFRRIRQILTVSAGMLVLLIGFVATRLDSHEYIHYRAMVAAIPVGAKTTIRLGDLRLSSFKKVVFPVPALPVRNKLALVFSIMSQAFRDSSFISILLCIFNV